MRRTAPRRGARASGGLRDRSPRHCRAACACPERLVSAIRGAPAKGRQWQSMRTGGQQPRRHNLPGGKLMIFIFGINPLIALGVLASTAATDAAYVFFNAAVSGRRRVRAANWSAIWYLLSAFAVISYTENAIYVLFAAAGSWLGAFASVTWLRLESAEVRHNPPP